MNVLIDENEIEKQHQIAVELHHFTKGKKAHVRTFGCQQNEADGERIAGELIDCGYTLTNNVAEADLVILNTCAIREHAEVRVLGIIGDLKKEKEKRPDMLIGMCGCMAQEAHRQEQLKRSYPFVDFLFGTDMNHRVPEILQNTFGRRKQKQYIHDFQHDEFGVIAEKTPVARSSSYKALVSIMYGCNNFCTYCIVPYVRGRERSRESNEIVTEVRDLAANGYRDIMLLGQNVNSYRGEMTFPELLEACANVGGDYWLKFMTSHPKDASRELVEVMKRNPKIADMFHLPFQSGNNRVLKAMNRKYTRESYLEKALMIKEELPNASITSDVIVGFPTETEKEFLDTVDLIKKVRFDMLFTFIYSPRKGTVAEKMEGRIPHEEQVRRFEYLSSVQNEIAQEKNNLLVGRTVRVLSDGYDEEGRPSGRNSQNKIVNMNQMVPAGAFCNVKITEARPYILSGTVEDDK